MNKQLDKLPFEGCIYEDYEGIKELLLESGRREDYAVPSEVTGLAWNTNYVWYFFEHSPKPKYYKYQFNDLLNKSLTRLPQLSDIPKEGSIIYDYEALEKLIIASGRGQEGKIPKEILGMAWNQDKYWYFAVGSDKKRYYKYQFNDLLNKENKQEINNVLILLKCEKLKNLLLI